MNGITVRELAEILAADLTDDPTDQSTDQPTDQPTDRLTTPITEVTVDSRTIAPGSLFVALPGEQADGHDFVPAAWQAGALAAVTTRPVPGGRCLVVEDAQVALGRIGRAVTDRARAGGLRVTGITGSQGKTSTKDLLAQILEAEAPTVAPVASLNNEIGVPLTACRVIEQTRFLISEMGARGGGHIRYLCGLTPPDVGVVLNVGAAHLGMFGSVEAIAEAKGELVEALPASGWAVLNLGDPRVAAMRHRTDARLVGFLEPDRQADPDAARAAELIISAEDARVDDEGRWSFTLRVSGGDQEQTAAVQLQLLGHHQIANALAATAAALALGVPAERSAAVLTAATPRSRWRMEVTSRPDGLVVLNDAYNANPASMSAALATLRDLAEGRRRSGATVRTVAVLGDMLELGEAGPPEHAEIGRLVAELEIDRLLAIGEYADDLIGGARAAGFPAEHARRFDALADVAQALELTTGKADLVLIKASRAIGLEQVADSMLAQLPTGSGGDQ